MRTRTTTSLIALLAVPLGACISSTDDGIPEVPNGMARAASMVSPDRVEGNPTCASLGLGDFQVELNSNGTADLGYGNSITVSNSDGKYFDWSSTIGIDAVIVKGGDAANVYAYDPEAMADTGLHSPLKNGGVPDLSHMYFCYDYEVDVTKTADTSYDRTYDWAIEKTGGTDSLLLSEGQTYNMDYAVTATVTGHTDSNYAVSGTIRVFNPAPMDATVTGVTDELDGTPIPVDCGVTFPVVLAPGEELLCTYESALADGTNRTNVAHATTTGIVGPDSGSAAVDFSAADITGIDGCVDVTDTLVGALGDVCVGDAPKTWNYDLEIGPFPVCGLYEVENTARLVTNDQGLTDADTWRVDIEVECPEDGGCSLTPGYWKTHSQEGPAPYDDTWAQLPLQEDTPFYNSGGTYYDALWRPIRGDAYYILARAFIAAQLNGLNGSSLDAVSAVYAQAEHMFETLTPADAAKGKNRKLFIQLAQVLDAYNNGIIGPGHCDEDSSSAD
ncbi:MAG: hypothetical protein JRI23_16135 [Deltaproteobacteria bacterium]|jgi:hypothetical protein|nr:hypothetical protein [Deltaproteobacteria bacterium]MBW2533300.1 hypothetical protein [Deltaproteobacteria bacterium]